jgi:hypothetical protein
MPGLVDQSMERLTVMDSQIFSNFSQKLTENKKAVAQIREERGLSNDQCIYCEGKIEQGRLIIKPPDCLKCHLERG